MAPKPSSSSHHHVKQPSPCASTRPITNKGSTTSSRAPPHHPTHHQGHQGITTITIHAYIIKGQQGLSSSRLHRTVTTARVTHHHHQIQGFQHLLLASITIYNLVLASMTIYSQHIVGLSPSTNLRTFTRGSLIEHTSSIPSQKKSRYTNLAIALPSSLLLYLQSRHSSQTNNCFNSNWHLRSDWRVMKFVANRVIAGRCNSLFLVHLLMRLRMKAWLYMNFGMLLADQSPPWRRKVLLYPLASNQYNVLHMEFRTMIDASP